jgi:hypothetical protein
MKNDQIKEAFRFLHQHESFLSQFQIDFVKSLRKNYNRNHRLSERQQKILFEIERYLNVTEKNQDRISRVRWDVNR